MKNNNIKIKVESSSYYFISFLMYNNINYSSLVKNELYYILIIDFNDLKKITNKYNVDILSYYGINCIKNYIKHNMHIIIGLLIGILILMILSNTTFDVVIYSESDTIKELLINELSKYEIEKYKRVKTFDEIEYIKNQIIMDNSDRIEWMSIKLNGCIYEINVNERILDGNNEKREPSNIIASKDGKILYINSISGQKLVKKGDYVKKGDVLITGNIYKGDKLVDIIESSGMVYAETWYTIKINIPFSFIEYAETGEIINHYYIELFNKKMTLLGKYDSKDTFNEKKLLIDKPYLFFKLYLEKKKVFEYQKYTYNENDAYNEALKRAEVVIKRKLNDEEYIISKKVLKKEVIRSKMYVEVFYKVYENITNTSRMKE